MTFRPLARYIHNVATLKSLICNSAEYVRTHYWFGFSVSLASRKCSFNTGNGSYKRAAETLKRHRTEEADLSAIRKLTKSSVKPAKFWRVKNKKNKNVGIVAKFWRKREKNCENCIWQHVCILFQRHFVVPWTYRLLRTSLRKIRMIFGSVLPYWSYSLHPLQAGYSAAPRCGYTLHFSLYSVKPTYWLQKASAQTAKRF